MPVTIRPLQLPEDYAAVAALLSTTLPDPVTAEALAEEDRHIPKTSKIAYDESGRLTGFCRERVLAVDDQGRALGYAAAWRAPWAEPGTLGSLFVVHPDARRQGVGSALVGHLESWARSLKASLLLSELQDHLPASLDFAQHRGFRLDGHVFGSTLDLTAFDETRFAGAIEKVQKSGIHFFTLAERPGEATEMALYDLYGRTLVDNPAFSGDLPSFEQWREEALGGVGERLEGVIMAADGERIVGVTTLFFHEAEPTVYTDYTGVDKEYRGRGIALALKLLSIRTAKTLGATAMTTDNDAENRPMLAVNERLGYVAGRGHWRIEKGL